MTLGDWSWARRLAALAGVVLILAGTAGWLFVPSVDDRLREALMIASDSALRLPLVIVTDIGSAAIMIPVAILAVALLLAKRRTANVLWLVGVIASGRLLVEIAKAVFARPRPPLPDRLVDVMTASFPSSHAAGSMLTALAICAVLRAPPAAWTAALCFGALVGLTRIALGVHYPTDVLAGWGFALLWVALALPLRSRGR